LALGLLLSASASLPAHADAKKDVEALMARYQQAFRKKDIAAMRAMTMPDFTMKPLTGRASTRQEVLSGLLAQMNAVQSIASWTLTIERFSVKGSTATAIVRERMSAVFRDGYGNRQTNVTASRLRDTFRRTPDGWKYQKAEELAADRKQDGIGYVGVDKLTPATPGDKAARRAIEARYAEYRNYMRRGELGALLALYTSDFSMDYPNGRTYNRSQLESSMRQTMAGTKSYPSWTMKIGRFSSESGEARVLIIEDMQSIVVDAGGHRHNQRVVDYYVDTWVKTPKGWKLQNTRVVRANVTVDGKAVDVFKGRG
jgi:ketosteroid isomerase-like protein